MSIVVAAGQPANCRYCREQNYSPNFFIDSVLFVRSLRRGTAGSLQRGWHFMLLWKRVFYAIISAVFATPGAAQSLIQDGGFDAQGASVATWCTSTACPAGAWQISGHLVRENTAAWGSYLAISPAIFSALQGGSSIQQTFTAPETGNLKVAFWVAGRPAPGGAQTVQVRINGTLIGSVTTTTGQAWARYVTPVFAVTAGQSYILQLSGTATTDQTAFVDGVMTLAENETYTYSYDSLGRLTSSAITRGPNNGTNSSACFDKAGNRRRYVAGAAAPPQCPVDP